MFETLMVVILTASPVNDGAVLGVDRDGKLRFYTSSDLTVDKTSRNRSILRSIRRDHNDRFISKHFRSPRITTHGGNGYMYNVNPYDSRFHKHMRHNPKRFKKYLKYDPLKDPALKKYLIKEMVPLE